MWVISEHLVTKVCIPMLVKFLPFFASKYLKLGQCLASNSKPVSVNPSELWFKQILSTAWHVKSLYGQRKEFIIIIWLIHEPALYFFLSKIQFILNSHQSTKPKKACYEINDYQNKIEFSSNIREKFLEVTTNIYIYVKVFGGLPSYLPR